MSDAPQLAADDSTVEVIVTQGKAVGDRLRARILVVLHEESYSVGELCDLFEVPQPALSHHLKILSQAGLVARRREGNNIFYGRASLPADSVGAALLSGLDGIHADAQLAERVSTIHQARRQRAADFFAQNAAEITAEQAQISEPHSYADLVMESLAAAIGDGLSTRKVLEVGPGGGELIVRLAEVFDGVLGIDSSTSMLDAARSASAGLGVKLEHRDFLTLPVRSGFDAIVAAMVVHHQPSPAAFFLHGARLLNPGGALVVAELCRHDQQWASEACGDQWLGFEPADLSGWAESAGLETVQSQYLAQKNGFRIQVHRYRATHRSNAAPGKLSPS